MSVKITSLKVKSFDLDHLDLFWEISPVVGPRRDEDRHEIFDYEFYIWRAGDSPMGPYEEIAGPLRDQYMIRDMQVSLLHKWRQYYYKIRVVHVPTETEEIFGPASSEGGDKDLIAAEIIRQEDILFREYTGRKCWLFIARTFGPLCTCWDRVLQRRTRSGHALCFDTGFLGGFMSPIEVHVQIDPEGKNSQATALGEIQPGDTAARMISFPPVSPRDILVESENTRWKVISVSNTERLRFPVHQELRIHAIPRGDIEYNLPLRFQPNELKKLTTSADRNFTNPQNLEQDGDYSDIYSAFGYSPRGALR